MTAITFDTLAFSKKLKKAGVPEKQAEAQAEIMASMMTETIFKNFATKHDLHTEVSRLRSDLTIRVGAMIAVGVTFVPLIFKLINLI